MPVSVCKSVSAHFCDYRMWYWGTALVFVVSEITKDFKVYSMRSFFSLFSPISFIWFLFIPCRTGQSQRAGEEENLPHYHQGFPAILCSSVSYQTRDAPDGTRGRDSVQSQRPIGSGFLSRGSTNQENQGWIAGEFERCKHLLFQFNCKSLWCIDKITHSTIYVQ